ncbi:hypothetical protein NIES4106_23160 [Fischerella sp. NIES-4106]|jgi:hypothetical protein|nr:hypothetical protein NIES4106_08580 [Fischerella sp. NIES-4106]BAZ67561.1 hypothetical protein NIES4106_23160 [Fischerella sp. NIES-4106]
MQHRPTLLIELRSITPVGQFVIAQKFIPTLNEAILAGLLFD